MKRIDLQAWEQAPTKFTMPKNYLYLTQDGTDYNKVSSTIYSRCNKIEREMEKNFISKLGTTAEKIAKGANESGVAISKIEQDLQRFKTFVEREGEKSDEVIDKYNQNLALVLQHTRALEKLCKDYEKLFATLEKKGGYLDVQKQTVNQTIKALSGLIQGDGNSFNDYVEEIKKKSGKDPLEEFLLAFSVANKSIVEMNAGIDVINKNSIMSLRKMNQDLLFKASGGETKYTLAKTLLVAVNKILSEYMKDGKETVTAGSLEESLKHADGYSFAKLRHYGAGALAKLEGANHAEIEAAIQIALVPEAFVGGADTISSIEAVGTAGQYISSGKTKASYLNTSDVTIKFHSNENASEFNQKQIDVSVKKTRTTHAAHRATTLAGAATILKRHSNINLDQINFAMSQKLVRRFLGTPELGYKDGGLKFISGGSGKDTNDGFIYSNYYALLVGSIFMDTEFIIINNRVIPNYVYYRKIRQDTLKSKTFSHLLEVSPTKRAGYEAIKSVVESNSKRGKDGDVAVVKRRNTALRNYMETQVRLKPSTVVPVGALYIWN